MWRSVLVPAIGILVLPMTLHGQCKMQQGAGQQAGRGMQMGAQMHGGQMGGGQMGGGQAGMQQMGGGQQGPMMHGNLVRDLLEESTTLGLTADQVTRLEPLAQRLDAMNKTFEGMHQAHAGRNLTEAARDSMRTSHMDVRQTNEKEVLKEVKAVLGTDTYVRALELLVVRRRGMN